MVVPAQSLFHKVIEQNIKYTHEVNLVGYSLHLLNRGHIITSASTTLITWNLLFYATKQLWTVGKPPRGALNVFCGSCCCIHYFLTSPECRTGSGSAGSGGQTKTCALHHICGLMGSIILWGGRHYQEVLCLVCRSILIGSICTNTTMNFRRGNVGVFYLFYDIDHKQNHAPAVRPPTNMVNML